MSTWDKRYTDRVQLLVDILHQLSFPYSRFTHKAKGQSK